MNDTLILNTEEDLIKEEKIDPLPLYDDSFQMLDDEIPEYNDVLPNPIMSKLIKRLKMTMKKFAGLGLSANQCGVYERVFILGYGEEMFACINPKIIEKSEEIERTKEGCLSYPGMFLTIARSKWIVAEFVNENGEVKRMRFEGITARCFLHELDHLNGIRFVNHTGRVALRLAKQKQTKNIKKMQRQFKNKTSMFV